MIEMIEMNEHNTDELYHFGIKGQKWGVRRYQNKDGSLTAKGKKRYEDPIVSESKNKMINAKKDYIKAYNKLNISYTNKNLKSYNLAKDTYKKSKLNYSANKEASRISNKGITFNNKSKHRLKLEESYRKMGLTKEQAEAAANKRIRTEKILAVSAGLTVTACAAYYAHSKYKNKIDGVIKAGENLQRIEMQNTNGKLYDVFYTSKGKHDNKRYYNMLGGTRQSQTGEAYIMKLSAKKDIKVASRDNAVKAFQELYEKDSNFRNSVQNSVSKHFTGINRVSDTSNMSKKNIRKMYENFNSNLVQMKGNGTGNDIKFYNKLKSMGYGAIQDVNDMKFSGYNAKNPLIVFDNSNNNIMVSSVNKIQKDLRFKAMAEYSKAQTEVYLKELGEKALVGSGAGLMGAAVYLHNKDPYKQNVKR